MEIQSLQRGLKALEAAVERDVRPQEVAEMLGVGRTTALRLLQTLVEAGYVQQSAVTKAFRANPAKIFSLASRLGSSLTWLVTAEVFLNELAQRTGETAGLAQLDGTEVVYVAVAASPNELSVRPVIGTRRPVHSSAIGKALLAYLDEQERAEILAKAGMPRLTWHTITSPGVFEAHIHEVKAKGFAIDDQENIKGVRCISAPVLARNGSPLAAIGILAPLVRLGDDRMNELCMVVKETGERLSESLWQSLGTGATR
jgi:DNA-binding IclR family transcriptional regulator